MSHRYTVQFRVQGPLLDPEGLTRALGLTPCRTITPGTLESGESQLDGLWAYDGSDHGPAEWERLEEGLTFVLDRLWPHRQALRDHPRIAFEIWWCGYVHDGFDGGPLISPELLARLGEFGARFYLDVHSLAPSP